MNHNSVACDSVRPVNSLDLGAMLEAAVIQKGHQHKAIGPAIGCQPNYWSRVLSGDRGIRLPQLAALPWPIQRAFVSQWAEALGLMIERRGPVGELADLLASKRVRISIEAR